MGEKMRLDKLLSNMGLGSRKEMNDALRYGWVKVNGVVMKYGKEKVDVETDEILYEGKPVKYQKYATLIMNKPQGVISATDDHRHQTVVDLLEEPWCNMNLFPVGRLDIDTEGLLILSNDGALSHNLLSPKKHVPKTYYAKIDKPVDDKDIEMFASGVTLEDDYLCKPAELKVIDVNESGISEIELVIYEGKFHQVKRMFESVGKNVIYLKRIKMGALELDPALALGEYRELTADEMELLQMK
jgi:16S rRNA pseudouridine516 synthase